MQCDREIENAMEVSDIRKLWIHQGLGEGREQLQFCLRHVNFVDTLGHTSRWMDGCASQRRGIARKINLRVIRI